MTQSTAARQATKENEMSQAAKAVIHYASNWRASCADDSDRDYCAERALRWAEWLIAGHSES